MPREVEFQDEGILGAQSQEAEEVKEITEAWDDIHEELGFDIYSLRYMMRRSGSNTSLNVPELNKLGNAQHLGEDDLAVLTD